MCRPYLYRQVLHRVSMGTLCLNIPNQLITDFNEFNLSLVFLCPTFILHKLASLNKLNACSTEMEMCCVQTNCLLTRTDRLFPSLINLATFIFSTGRTSSCSFLFIVPITPKHIIVPLSKTFFPMRAYL